MAIVAHRCQVIGQQESSHFDICCDCNIHETNLSLMSFNMRHQRKKMTEQTKLQQHADK